MKVTVITGYYRGKKGARVLAVHSDKEVAAGAFRALQYLAQPLGTFSLEEAQVQELPSTAPAFLTGMRLTASATRSSGLYVSQEAL